ncbi:uncharacterized protein LOC112554308 isoform X2 [Pomacea canaliculata]|uniref:uncharacterized protein LOC112554308 isoform X2 n=1 Tax=Pomacea canaliculata TaxID=400727 RepID=UPI000D738353|nr:uncharacterized protein LOC112554308 isoform X2 [Pomacea canaliculata]
MSHGHLATLYKEDVTSAVPQANLTLYKEDVTSAVPQANLTLYNETVTSAPQKAISSSTQADHKPPEGTSSSSTSSEKYTAPIIAGGVIGGLVVLTIIISIVIKVRARAHRGTNFTDDVEVTHVYGGHTSQYPRGAGVGSV